MAAREGSPSFRELARPVVRLALLTTAVFLLFPEVIVRMLAPGLPPATAEMATRLLRITAFAIPAVSSSLLFTALLYSERRFAFPAFHQGMVNISTIIVALLLYGRLGAFGFAIGYAIGTWLQLGAAYAISRPILKARPQGSARAKLRDLLSVPARVLCYSLLVGLNPVITRALASTFGSGATAAFDYSLKLVGVPLGLLVVPLSSSLLSEIAPFRLRKDRQSALGTIGRAAMATALASTLLVVVMLFFAPWIVAVLLERGQFDTTSTRTVSSILYGFYPVLVAWSVLDVVSRSMFSLGRPRVPILAAVLALGINVLLSVLGPISSIQWIGVPAVVGLLTGAMLAAGHVWRSAAKGRKA
jgi:putative peptidoglycan lipid II flippase